MKLSELKSHQDIVSEALEYPEYRAEWERTSLAHEVAMKVIQYRVENQLSQTELARRLGMRQPHIARLEAGDHEPSLANLHRLASALGLEFHIHITCEAISLTVPLSSAGPCRTDQESCRRGGGRPWTSIRW